MSLVCPFGVSSLADMSGRQRLETTTLPKEGGYQLRRLSVGGPAGTLRIITPRMREDFGRHTQLLGRSASPVAAVSEHTAAAHGLEFGFYLDHAGAVHHVHEERAEIESSRDMLRAADAGLMTLSNTQRDRMERQVELLDRWDALQARRLGAVVSGGDAPSRDLLG